MPVRGLRLCWLVGNLTASEKEKELQCASVRPSVLGNADLSMRSYVCSVWMCSPCREILTLTQQSTYLPYRGIDVRARQQSRAKSQSKEPTKLPKYDTSLAEPVEPPT